MKHPSTHSTQSLTAVVSRRMLLLTTAASLLTAGTSLAQRQAAPNKDHHVVVICIDGLGAYNLDDPNLPLPNIHRLAERGARAKAMTVSTPSVTWPNHTTMVTGVAVARHGVLANGRLEKPETGGALRMINPRRSKAELCRAVTVYDRAHAAGLRTAEVNWPVTRDAETLDHSFPDYPDNIGYTTPSLREELVRMKLLPEPTDAAFRRLGIVAKDHIWTQAAVHLIKRHKPNLLLFHLLNTDSTQHAHSPQTTEARTAFAMADRHVGDLLQAIRESGLEKRTTVFIVADHGFIRVTKQINPNVRLQQAGFIRPSDSASNQLQYEAQSVSEGGLALVYVADGNQNPAKVARVKSALENMEGIERILSTPSEFREHGLPAPGSDTQAPHLVLCAKTGYAFANATSGEEIVTLPRPIGTHGYPHTNPMMDGTFVASGARIKRGLQLDRVKNTDLAPTIARLLGVSLPEAEGRVLTEILTDK